MDALRIGAIGSVALGALTAAQPPAPPAAQPAAALGTQDLATGLAQDLFQRTFQAAAVFPLAEPAAPDATLALSSTASLLAALEAPQAPAEATPVPADATPADATPAAATPAAAAPSTAPPANPAAALPGAELPGVQDATSLEFALQTALRFGAGVGAVGAPLLQTPDLAPGLVRDLTAVPRQRNLQPHAGGPGPEAFAHPQAPARVVQRAYLAPPVPEASGQLDVLA